MPTPIIVTAKVTLRMLRWPTLRVAQPKAQAMPIMSTPLAIRACRIPPNPVTITRTTAASERQLAKIIDSWLVRISSSSITGRPVSPIEMPG